MSTAPVEGCTTLVDVLTTRAGLAAGDTAFTFLESATKRVTLTWSDLDARARTIAQTLRERCAPGDRVLLLYPSGLEYVAAFFGCLYAGAVAVPVYPPRPGRSARRLRSVVADAGAKVALTTEAVLAMVRAHPEHEQGLSAMAWIATDALDVGRAEAWTRPDIDGDALAFLQYTSGSTAMPKGVMLTHRHLIHNERQITACFRNDLPGTVVVGWLPLYHDMGLIGNVINPIWCGMPCVLLAPETFLMRPIRWLQALSEFRGTVAGAPNFAFDLCVRKVKDEQLAELDLSSWRVAYNGAEPIRPATLDEFVARFAGCGFRREAFHPVYGLAEATLFVTGPPAADEPVMRELDADALAHRRAEPVGEGGTRHLVGCGGPWLEQEVVIVEPDTRVRLADGEVGEIWVRGPNVAAGYWGQPALSEETFRARLSDGPAQTAGDAARSWLRTGDLGFWDRGQLFIAGRVKDLIILGGRNFYPQDIELVTEEASEGIRSGCVAAFPSDDDAPERLVVVAEVLSRWIRGADDRAARLEALAAAIREAIFDTEGVAPDPLVLIKQGTIPKTSSGKIQRRATRQQWLDGTLVPVTA